MLVGRDGHGRVPAGPLVQVYAVGERLGLVFREHVVYKEAGRDEGDAPGARGAAQKAQAGNGIRQQHVVLLLHFVQDLPRHVGVGGPEGVHAQLAAAQPGLRDGPPDHALRYRAGFYEPVPGGYGVFPAVLDIIFGHMSSPIRHYNRRAAVRQWKQNKMCRTTVLMCRTT